MLSPFEVTQGATPNPSHRNPATTHTDGRCRCRRPTAMVVASGGAQRHPYAASRRSSPHRFPHAPPQLRHRAPTIGWLPDSLVDGSSQGGRIRRLCVVSSASSPGEPISTGPKGIILVFAPQGGRRHSKWRSMRRVAACTMAGHTPIGGLPFNMRPSGTLSNRCPQYIGHVGGLCSLPCVA